MCVSYGTCPEAGLALRVWVLVHAVCVPWCICYQGDGLKVATFVFALVYGRHSFRVATDGLG